MDRKEINPAEDDENGKPVSPTQEDRPDIPNQTGSLEVSSFTIMTIERFAKPINLHLTNNNIVQFSFDLQYNWYPPPTNDVPLRDSSLNSANALAWKNCSNQANGHPNLYQMRPGLSFGNSVPNSRIYMPMSVGHWPNYNPPIGSGK